MKILFETSDEPLIANIQHWFRELEYRVYYSGVEFKAEDLIAIKNEPYIIVMANVMLTDYDDNLEPFQRRNVTIEYQEQKLKPEITYWSDGGRFLIGSGTMGLSVGLMPIFRPDLIVMLNEDGSLFKDGLSTPQDLEKIIEVDYRGLNGIS